MSRMLRMQTRIALAALVASVVSACGRETPEVGRLGALYVPPAEDLQIFSLSSGETFGDLLYPVISANEQAALLMAFQEHASPRRMRQGTEITLRYLREDDSLRGIDVALTPDQTVRLSRNPVGWSSDLIRTPIYVDTLYVSGEIETVLWNLGRAERRGRDAHLRRSKRADRPPRPCLPVAGRLLPSDPSG